MLINLEDIILLKDLIINCELVVLSSNSKHIINDVDLAFKAQKKSLIEIMF